MRCRYMYIDEEILREIEGDGERWREVERDVER